MLIFSPLVFQPALLNGIPYTLISTSTYFINHWIFSPLRTIGQYIFSPLIFAIPYRALLYLPDRIPHELITKHFCIAINSQQSIEINYQLK